MKFLILFCLSLSVFSQDIPLEGLLQDDLEELIGEFSANFNHTSVTSASKLGKIWGFQVGLVGGLTKTPKLDELMKEADPSSKGLSNLPSLGLVGKVSVPFGLSAELSMIPKFKFQGVEVKNFGMALSYDFSSALPLPIGIGIKGSYTTTDIGFESTVNGSKVIADYNSKVKGIGLFFHKKFLIVEPYLGIGYASTNGELGGSATFFDNQLTATDRAKAVKSSSHFVLGLNANLLAFKLGAEYTRLFGTSKIVGKLNFGL